MAVGIGLVLASGLAAVALRFRWTFAPITAFTGFLYTIPSVALFGLLNTSFGNTASAEIALVSYTLLVLVRNIVAGIDGVPAAVTDAADGLGMSRGRRLLSVRGLPLALPGDRGRHPKVGHGHHRRPRRHHRHHPGLGGLGDLVLIFDGYGTQYFTKIVVGSGPVGRCSRWCSTWPSTCQIEVALTPWARRRVPA